MNAAQENSPPGVLRIVGLAGSLRQKSYTQRAVESVLDGARQVGGEAKLLDLRELSLPFCKAADAEQFADVELLRGTIRQAHGFVWGTPEYHGSFSGLLKNALDLTEPEDWRGKVVALVGVSGGSAGPGSALAGLRSVVRGLEAWALPNQVAIPTAYQYFTETGPTHNAKLLEQLTTLGAELVRFARLHSGL
jgi:FMN reductase